MIARGSDKAGSNAEYRRKIDVHAHFLPPVYRKALSDAGLSRLDGGFPVPQWSAPAAIETMNRLGVQAAVLSVSSPCMHFLDGMAAQRLARSVNEDAAKLVLAHPGRFGAFASLPLPNVQGSVEELSYALDVLRLDGVIMETNARGVYLGDERLDPIFAALSERHASLLIHPTSPACCEHVAFGRPAPMIEFHFDTTRAIVNLIFSRTLVRYPGMNVIVPHGGAALPILVPRLAMFAEMPILESKPDNGESLLDELKQLHFDMAASAHPAQFAALRAWVATSQILFGTDWPFTPEAAIVRNIDNFARLNLTAEERHAIEYGNASRLFPRLSDQGNQKQQMAE